MLKRSLGLIFAFVACCTGCGSSSSDEKASPHDSGTPPGDAGAPTKDSSASDTGSGGSAGSTGSGGSAGNGGDAMAEDAGDPKTDGGDVEVDSCPAGPTTYYISSSTGDDSRTDTEARDPTTPWRSIDKLNAFASSLVPGACVLFRRGDVFQGGIALTVPGTENNPITIGAYGKGARPQITGFSTVSAWTSLGGQIWESSNAVSTLDDLAMVVINGVNTAMGRLPKTGYWTATAVAKGSITDDTQLDAATTNWKGAEVVIRVRRWVIERYVVTGASAHTLTFTSTSNYVGYPGWGYFIQNDPRTLTQQNDWYYDRTTHKLRIFSQTQPTDVRVTSVNSGAKNSNTADYVTYDSLEFTGFNHIGIDAANGCKGLTVKNCDLSFIGIDGINNHYSSPNFTATGNSLTEINNSGIRSRNDYNVITGNTVTNIGTLVGMGASDDSGYEGIISSGASAEISYNVVKNIGYAGIYWDGDGVLISNNYVDTTLFVKDDGGGIYNWSPLGTIYPHQRVVRDNVVLNSIGALDGVAKPAANDGQGIYNDNSSGNLTIKNNTVAHAQLGIFLHGGHDIDVTDNTVYDCFYGLQLVKHNDNVLSNLAVNGNVFVSRTAASPKQYPMFLDPGPDAATMPATFTADYNTYARPIDPSIADSDVIRHRVNGASSYDTLAKWIAYSGQDKNAHPSPKSVASLSDIQFVYNETSANKTIPLSGNFVDMKNAPHSGSITLAPFTSAVLLRSP